MEENKQEEIKKEETVEIKIGAILLGLFVGVVASLWTIIPFFFAGIGNFFFMSVIAGLALLILLTKLEKKKIITSGIIAFIVFFLVSYVAVPFVSGLVLGSNDVQDIQAKEGLETVNLQLPGLFCQACAYSSQTALKGIPGVADAKVSFPSKSGVVVYDPNVVSVETILSNDVIRAYGGKVE